MPSVCVNPASPASIASNPVLALPSKRPSAHLGDGFLASRCVAKRKRFSLGHDPQIESAVAVALRTDVTPLRLRSALSWGSCRCNNCACRGRFGSRSPQQYGSRVNEWVAGGCSFFKFGHTQTALKHIEEIEICTGSTLADKAGIQHNQAPWLAMFIVQVAAAVFRGDFVPKIMRPHPVSIYRVGQRRVLQESRRRQPS